MLDSVGPAVSTEHCPGSDGQCWTHGLAFHSLAVLDTALMAARLEASSLRRQGEQPQQRELCGNVWRTDESQRRTAHRSAPVGQNLSLGEAGGAEAAGELALACAASADGDKAIGLGVGYGMATRLPPTGWQGMRAEYFMA